MQFKPAPQAAPNFARPASPPEPAAPVFAYEEADEVTPAFAFLDEDAQTEPKSRSSDPYGLDEGRPSPRSASGSASAPEPAFVLPQRVAPRKGKASKKGSSGGRGWAIGGGIGGGAVGLLIILRIIFVAIRIGAAAGGMGGDSFAANEAKLEQSHQEYLNTFHQLIDVFGSVHDVPSAMQADPKAQALLRQMGALNRSAMGVRVSQAYLERLKARMQSEAQIEGQKLAGQLMRVGMIPGVRPALQGSFSELERLAKLEQEGMRNMGVH